MIELFKLKDEVLDGEPRYTIKDNAGNIINDNVQVELKTQTIEEGTPLNRATFDKIFSQSEIRQFGDVLEDDDYLYLDGSEVNLSDYPKLSYFPNALKKIELKVTSNNRLGIINDKFAIINAGTPTTYPKSYYSNDGENWNEILVPSTSKTRLNDIAYGNGVYLKIVSVDGTLKLYSTNSLDSLGSEISYSNVGSGIIFCDTDNKFYMAKSSAYIYRSTDGNSWSSVRSISSSATLHTFIGNYVLYTYSSGGTLYALDINANTSSTIRNLPDIIEIYRLNGRVFVYCGVEYGTYEILSDLTFKSIGRYAPCAYDGKYYYTKSSGKIMFSTNFNVWYDFSPLLAKEYEIISKSDSTIFVSELDSYVQDKTKVLLLPEAKREYVKLK